MLPEIEKDFQSMKVDGINEKNGSRRSEGLESNLITFD